MCRDFIKTEEPEEEEEEQKANKKKTHLRVFFTLSLFHR